MFDKFPAPTLVLQVPPKTKKVRINDHSRSNTIEFMLKYINQ